MPFDQPLSIHHALITTQGATMRTRVGEVLVAEYTFQAASVDAAGRCFAIGAEPGGLALWQQSIAAGRSVAFPGWAPARYRRHR